jgi:hypothetical protein
MRFVDSEWRAINRELLCFFRCCFGVAQPSPSPASGRVRRALNAKIDLTTTFNPHTMDDGIPFVLLREEASVQLVELPDELLALVTDGQT